MPKKAALGITEFEDIIGRNAFYVDKTYFIRDWYNSLDQVTLITRPRRFGKTLTLNMVETFFSMRFRDRGDLFEGLLIWEDADFKGLQGTIPVINFSLANVKQDTCESMCYAMRTLLSQLFRRHSYLLDSDRLSIFEKEMFQRVLRRETADEDCMTAIQFLSQCMYEHFGKKVMILIDEYDTPMLEAYTAGYWEEAIKYIRRMFHAAFKDNPWLDRGLMTGITRITQESIFSDLNNPRVVTTTVEMYETCFGFTEKEVFDALEEYGLSDQKEEVKRWYDGFRFGKQSEIYNPWSIINFLSEKKLKPYWMNTSGNTLVGKLVQEGSLRIKDEFETLLQGGSIVTKIDESITYTDLSDDSKTVWSWFLTTGYVRIVQEREKGYEIQLTNYEVREAFCHLIEKWFAKSYDNYTGFIEMLLKGNLEGMQRYMEKVTLRTFSFFDVGGASSESEMAEQFYHGFTLGLIADLNDTHILTSNRESGFGRYDVSIEPLDKTQDGIIIEFKVFDSKKEQSLNDTARRALDQIRDMKYETDLKARGIRKVRKYGFAFRGKEVLIEEEKREDCNTDQKNIS
ncbi:MAG: ATP-binding protein [Lachnospiraceae bacterium]|nr:ATP-binding protein [Lachnospiraceae bacterium]